MPNDIKIEEMERLGCFGQLDDGLEELPKERPEQTGELAELKKDEPCAY